MDLIVSSGIGLLLGQLSGYLGVWLLIEKEQKFAAVTCFTITVIAMIYFVVVGFIVTA